MKKLRLLFKNGLEKLTLGIKSIGAKKLVLIFLAFILLLTITLSFFKKSSIEEGFEEGFSEIRHAYTYIDFSTNANTTATPAATTTRMSIDHTGNVGIGTTSPQHKLVVSNAGSEGLEIVPGNGAGSTVLQSYNRSDSTYDTMDLRASDFKIRICRT